MTFVLKKTTQPTHACTGESFFKLKKLTVLLMRPGIASTLGSEFIRFSCTVLYLAMLSCSIGCVTHYVMYACTTILYIEGKLQTQYTLVLQTCQVTHFHVVSLINLT